MTFHRERLPDPALYFNREGLHLKGGGKWRTTRCTIHGGSDSMRVHVETGGYVCMACGACGGNVLDYHLQAHGLGFVDAARALGALTDDDRPATTPAERVAMHLRLAADRRERDATQRTAWAKAAERNAALLAEGNPVAPVDPVARYLAGRGLGAWLIAKCIRCHPALPYWHTDDDGEIHMMGRFAAMLAPILRGGQLLAVHRTYLDGGRKARVPTAKKLTSASGPLAGACVPLAAPRAYVIGIAEGVETAVAASLGSGLPVVAAYCASALVAYQWPAGVARLVIFGDCDDAGRAAADKLRMRALAARVRCDVWAAREGATA